MKETLETYTKDQLFYLGRFKESLLLWKEACQTPMVYLQMMAFRGLVSNANACFDMGLAKEIQEIADEINEFFEKRGK